MNQHLALIRNREHSPLERPMYGVTHRNPIPRVVGSIGFF